MKAIKKIFNEPRNQALFTSINILLGVGPIIVPAPFYKAGFVLSTIWILINLAISYLAATYIAESMQLIAEKQSQNAYQQSMLTQNQPSQTNITDTPTQSTENVKTYDHNNQFSILYGPKSRYFPSLAISIYLLGISISKCIMTGNILSKVFKNVSVLNNFLLWLGIFFISGTIFSFKSIEKTKALQITIIVVRFLSIAMMIIGSFVVIGMNGGVQSMVPPDGGVVNMDFFGQIFSNLVFSFLFHHSLPGISKQLKNRQDVNYFLRYAFAFSGITLIIIPYTAMLAFGQNLGTTHDLIYYNYDFKGKIDFIYYFVSFYVFLNVAAFSVYIIIIRTNILALVKPQVNPNKLSKITIITSLGILLVILVVSFFLKNDIQIVISFSGGILGAAILFYIPTLEILGARKLVNAKVSRGKRYLPIAIMIIGTFLSGYNLYQIVLRTIK